MLIIAPDNKMIGKIFYLVVLLSSVYPLESPKFKRPDTKEIHDSPYLDL